MKSITGIVITKNEEKNISECLESISFCDEMIVIDNGSTDKTKEISEKKGAKVFELSTNDFSKLRNYGLEKANGDWVLYVDADERVTEELVREIKSILISPKFDAYRIKRKNFYLGSSRKNEWPYVEKLERLFKKKSLKGWEGSLHESPIVKGRIGDLENYLLHFSHRDLTQMLSKTIEWSEVEADLRFKNNHPKMSWWRFPRVMLSAFISSYIIQGGWKIGTAGLVESIYQAFSIFITYSRLWELQNAKIKNTK